MTMGSIIEVEINRGATPDAYEVQVIQSPAGEASAVIQLASDRLLACRQELQQVLLASAVSRRGLVSHGERSVRDVGHELFTALFSSPGVSGRFRASCAVAEERGESLRMVLRVNAPELAALPWEAMYDSETAAYVCRREPLVRYVPVASAAAPLRVRLPLRVLALASSPRGLPPLDVEKERHDLTQALSEAVKVGAVDLQWAESATWSGLQDLLLSQEWHVLHFIGHGDFDVEQDEGVLALVGEDGRVNRVAADRFVDLLREAQPMPRLVVLNSCATATSGAQDLFSGTAAALVRGGVSAVAAMQFEISDAAAIEFCHGFYAAIARGRGVDEAVRSGRVAILGTGGATLEWITPVLYLRGLDAHLFAVDRKSPDQTSASDARAADDTARTAGESAIIEEQYTEAMAAYGRGDYNSAITLFDGVLTRRPHHRDAAFRRDNAVLKLRLNEAFARGRAAENAKDWSSAADAYQDVLELDPQHEDAASRRDACRYRSAAERNQPGTFTTQATTPRSESQVGTGSGTDLPQGSRTRSRPEEPIEPDPLKRLWQRANEVAWTSRPYKLSLNPLAAVLPSQERVLGVCRLPFTLYTSCTFAVTSENLYFSSKGDDRFWKNLHENTPAIFRVNEQVLKIPVTAVDACAIAKDTFVLQVVREPAITFKVYQPETYKPLVERFLNAARSSA